VARCRSVSAARLGLLLATGLSIAAVAGCASGGAPGVASGDSTRAGLQRYLQQIEPIRLAVNRLLNGADPILGAFHDRRITPAQAARRMGELERQFAAYTVAIAAITPTIPALRFLHAEYAHTYILEDSYLSALVSGLAQHELGDLPNTQSTQRVAIIAWRTGLTVLARDANLVLPADLQQAGRGEIAPSPGGS
jgi:hypothetical protein